MVRVVLTGGGTLVVGRTSPGRGAWLCGDSPECLERAARRRAFGRALHGEVAAGEIDRLRAVLGAQMTAPAGDGPGASDKGRPGSGESPR